MKYIFRYFAINQHFTHIAKIKNFPEAKWMTGVSVPDCIESEVKYYPHCTGQWKEIPLNLLTIVWYRCVFGVDWKAQLEYELTGKVRLKEEVRLSEIVHKKENLI